MTERIHVAFEQQVRRGPDRVAVIAGRVRTSYGELDAHADRVAARLRQAGAGPGALVGVCVPRDEHLLPALLGVLKSGAAYVPLDPAYPAERLAFIAADTGMSLVLTTRAAQPAVDGLGAAALVLDAAQPDTAQPDTPTADTGTPADAAYVIYTSGSTGRPKGVVVEHRQTMNLLRWEQAAYPAEDLRGMLATASVCFDPSISQLFLPLIAGGTVILADNLLALPALPARDEVTTVYGVPSALAALLRQPLPHGVRAVFAGGEPLTRALVDRIYANPGVARVRNLYGPTECTTTCAIADVPREEAGEPSLGRAVAGAVLTVRDPDGRPVPDGELGELWIGGPVVARGYLGRVSTAFTVEPDGGRVYRSGDLVRRDGDVLRFAGRADDQVKVRGYRVEPGEVEAVLVRHPAVRRACVLARTDADGAAFLEAHVEADALDERELRAWLAERVPEHLVPTRFRCAERLPLNPNGKIDKAALPEVAARRDTTVPYLAPRTPAEAAVAALVGDVLGLPPVGVLDRFGDLGGHSLTAARLCALVGREFGTAVPLAAFLAEPTAAALTALVAAGAAEPSRPGLTRHAGTGRYPLTPTQRELWTLRQISGVPQVTTVAFRARLTGPVTADELRRALGALVSRHEVLRSRVVEQDGEPVAVVGAYTDVPVTEHDLRDLPADQRDHRAAGIAEAAARHAFDLAAPVPLLRVELIRHGAGTAELVAVSDHLACDGWSVGVLLTDLAAELGRPGSAEAPGVQVGDVALRPDTRAGQAAEQWGRELAGATPPSDLFTGKGGFQGGRLTRPLPPALVAGLTELSTDCGTSAFTAYLTGLGLLLAGLTARADVLVGAVAARRAEPELDRVFGPLVDVLPVRLRLDGCASLRDALGTAAATTARALDLPRPSTDDLFHAIGTQSRGAMITPVVLSAQPSGMPVRARSGPVAVDLLGELGCGAAQNPLTVFVNETVDGVELQVEYDLELLDPDAAAVFADRLLLVLAGLPGDPDRPLARLPLVTDAEQAELLRVAVGPALDAAPTVVDAIAAHVAARPGDTAAVGAAGQLTFQQLWDLSTEIAGVLRGAGVGRGDVVGVCLPRDHRLPSTLLGVWRAGAAYLPLEPELPAERLAWLAADGGARVVLCRTATAETAATVAGTRPLDLDTAPSAGPVELDPVGGDDLTYLLYTSGSTGTPKGVAVAQRGLASLAASLGRVPGIGPGDRMLAVATLSFDTSCAEMWSSLSSGACVVVVERDAAVDGHRLAERIHAHGVTAMNVPPTMLRTLLASGWTGKADLRIWSGGETLDPALARDLLGRVGELWNAYGPTEATVLSAAYRVLDVAETVPIGHAMPGERLYVMDPLGRLAPPGAAGELWIGGAGPALGYHRRPELTAAAFVPDPHSPGGRCYRTGDLVRLRADGELAFCGRRDHQLKIRGYRVELGEIESVLRDHPQVAHAVVVAHGHGAEAHLVGYVVGRSAVTGDEAAAHLRTRLPEYLVPHRWVVLDAFPVMPSGKVDLAALPQPGADRPHTPPRSAMEQLVAEAWAQTLTAADIGADDSFFGLGGHSLAATRVVGRLREGLGCAVPVRLLFEHPVLSDFARQLEDLVIAEITAESGRRGE
ncbi:amino acid adenylation domain-containing protein [Catellatospora sp. KI3]|uniref:non-ribosomal peptide synthetase n=1 Tax=Catellatospora sp. KI3 TaxID=3041620 RepID=UPI002482DC95|nr:non-ribosomal peptide synthetase [Catellatospora sp. KI3]MDI1462624.1 amino acid adenylation domain-containing protein [Catellatospora sp. KI3]